MPDADQEFFRAIPLLPVPVHAGFPSPGADYSERSLNVHDLVVRHPHATFFIRVVGQSMAGACIHSGDVIVVDRALTASHRKVVVVRIGQDLLLKRVQVQERKVFLHADPSTPELPAIEFHAGHDMEMWGVVTYCIHQVR